MTHRRTALIAELLIVFFLIPLLIAEFGNGKGLIGILWVAVLITYLVMRKHSEFTNLNVDWNWAAVTRANLKPIFVRFIPCAVLICIFTLLYDPNRFLSFILDRPQIWAMVMVLYPLLSVVPQEFVYRTYFCKRYAPLFDNQNILILFSALAFGWMHIVLHNWVAISLCLIGGVFFAHTYLKHKSLALASIEHSLYGCYIFTIGLGWYFYHARFQ